ncbi:MAG: site-specific DNA-methyltransferase [Treponema sp.]|nr:site-specific DNA-methyltransferase [Treponema sp.]
MAIGKLNLRADSQDKRFVQLKQLYPEIFSDGNLNIEALKEACGLETEEDGYYGLYWPGKNEAKRLARKEATGTLELVEGDGVNEDTTHNIYIEGDNLEVLRTLKKSYQNRVKMIYIDPPYNTGNDFIYPDNYQEPVEDYLRFTGQIDDNGNMLVANPKSSGKFHRRWLNMMYPRLQLAREVLTDDGVIFISIDDNEQANLKLLCDDVFGEGNFVGDLIIETATDNNPSQIITQHEYMFCYAKSKDVVPKWNRTSEAAEKIKTQYIALKNKGLSIENIQSELRAWIKKNKEELPQVAHYNNVDSKGVYSSSGNSSNPHPGGYMFDIIHPITNKPCPKPENGWRWPEETFKKFALNDEVEWGKDHTTQPHIKKRIETAFEQLRSIIYEDNRSSTKNLESLFGGIKVFDNPKPVSVLYKLIDYVTSNGDIVIDFFAGSSSTSEAVMQINSMDSKYRKFIMVQLPVNLDESLKTSTGESKKQIETSIKYLNSINKKHTICELGKQRIRLAGSKILEEANTSKDNPLDLGFKVYRLAKSNFTAFENISGTDKSALDTLFATAEKEPLTEGWKERKSSVIAELCLRHGFVLDSAITKCPEYTKNEVFKIVDQNEEKTMFVCLDEKISEETAKNLKLEDGEKFICLDSAIGDQLKVQLADKGRIETI